MRAGRYLIASLLFFVACDDTNDVRHLDAWVDSPVYDAGPDAAPVDAANVTVAASASTGGTVLVSEEDGGSCSGTSCTLATGASAVTFTPVASADYRFDSWTGASCIGYTAGSGDAITFTNPIADHACTAEFIATVDVVAVAGTGGSVVAASVTGGACTGTSCTLDSGAGTVTFTPTAGANHAFVGWVGCTGYTQTGSSITFTNPTSAKTCTANFGATVVVMATAGTGGTVAASSITGGSCVGTNCTLDSGASTVTFTPTASANHRFGSWSGCTGYTQSGNAITFTNPTTAKSCTASFVSTVSVSATAGTGGSVAASGVTGGSCSGTNCTLDSGASTVTFTATASGNYRFTGWSGCSTSTSAAIAITNPTASTTCTASFTATVVVSATAGAGGTVAASAVTGGSCSGTSCTLDSGASTVTFTPTPSANFRFGSWSGCTGFTQSGNAITFTNPTAAKACTASFVATVAVSATAGTGGTVAASGISGGSCTGTSCTLDSGSSTVTFTPTPNANFRFGSWSGCTGFTQSGNAITFTNPTAAKSCTASFVATVAVSATAGTGGTVAASAITGGSCSGTSCTLDSGSSTVTFTPTASSNHRFAGWSGSTCTGYSQTGNAITFTNPASAKACTASFTATVSVSATAGTGGTVSAGAITGGTCSGTSCTLDSGASTVTFTPAASSNHRFAGWSGSTCTGFTQTGNAITFTNPTSAKACTASFVATVNVAATAGTGGTVAASNLSGGSCSGTSCTLDSGASTVTFTATPSANYRFGSWSGCSTSTNEAITITNPTVSTTCTANFVATVAVDAIPMPAAGGSVSVSNLMNGTCSGSSCVLDSGNSTVQFTPSPVGNFQFNGWSGCTGYLQGAGSSIIFSNPTAAKSCTASFVEVVTIETGVSGAGGGAIEVSNLSNGTCSGTACDFGSGTGFVRFTPVPEQGYRFAKWSGSLCSGYGTGQGDDIFWDKPTASAKCVANFEPAVTIKVTDIIGTGSVVVSFKSNATCTASSFPSCLVSTGAGTVTFKPVPGPSSQFQKWFNCTGYTVANDGSATFTNPLQSQSCVAGFSP